MTYMLIYNSKRKCRSLSKSNKIKPGEQFAEQELNKQICGNCNYCYENVNSRWKNKLQVLSDVVLYQSYSLAVEYRHNAKSDAQSNEQIGLQSIVNKHY